MAKGLFLIFPGHGHVNPTIGLVTELINKGDQITYITAEEFRDKLEKLGVTFKGYDEEYSVDPNNKEGMIADVRKAIGIYRNLIELALKQESTFDYLVCDSIVNPGKKLIKKLGIKNGPIFMQGFYDNGIFRFFDPGLRFPGVDYELVFKKVFGIDLMKAMVQIALFGKTNIEIPENVVFLNGKRAAVLYLTIRACIIAQLGGEKEVIQNENVISYLPRCKVGEKISWAYNVNQRLGEADLLCEDTRSLVKTIDFVNTTLKATDENNNDVIFARFDTSRIDK